MRLVFDETGGIPFKYVDITELPVAAEALSIRGFVTLQRRHSGPYTWAVAITGEGSAWAHLHLLRRH